MYAQASSRPAGDDFSPSAQWPIMAVRWASSRAGHYPLPCSCLLSLDRCGASRSRSMRFCWRSTSAPRRLRAEMFQSAPRAGPLPRTRSGSCRRRRPETRREPLRLEAIPDRSRSRAMGFRVIGELSRIIWREGSDLDFARPALYDATTLFRLKSRALPSPPRAANVEPSNGDHLDTAHAFRLARSRRLDIPARPAHVHLSAHAGHHAFIATPGSRTASSWSGLHRTQSGLLAPRPRPRRPGGGSGANSHGTGPRPRARLVHPLRA